MNLQMTEEEGIDWCNLWNCYVPAKVTTFVWKLLQNRIPTKDNLAQRGVIQQGDKM